MRSPEVPLDPNLPDERLERWLDGDLPADEAAQVAEAVRRYEAWAQAASAARHVQAVLNATPAPIAPPDFTACVMREVTRHTRETRVPFPERIRQWARVPVWRPAFALAAVVLVAVAVWPRPPQPTDAEVAAAVEEVQWTLAYLSHTSGKTGLRVRDEIIAPHVVAPVRQLLSGEE